MKMKVTCSKDFLVVAAMLPYIQQRASSLTSVNEVDQIKVVFNEAYNSLLRHQMDPVIERAAFSLLITRGDFMRDDYREVQLAFSENLRRDPHNVHLVQFVCIRGRKNDASNQVYSHTFEFGIEPENASYIGELLGTAVFLFLRSAWLPGTEDLQEYLNNA